LLICCFLVLLTFAAFYPVCTRAFEFVGFDDEDYVTQNVHFREGLTPAGCWWALTSIRAYNWHPLTWLSLQLDYQCFRLDPRGYHLTNLLLHTANACLLFLALWYMSGARWPSAAVAAFFAVHPLHVESVAWVAERKDVLSTFFALLTLLAYTSYARRPRLSAYLLVMALLALGLMAKPMLVTLPFLLLLLDYWPLGRLRGRSRTRGPVTDTLPPGATGACPPALPWLRLVAEKVPLFALVAASCLLTLWAQQGVLKSREEFPLGARVANALVTYGTYLGQMAWPTRLAVLYPHPGTAVSPLSAAVVGAGLATVSLLVLGAARRRPYLVVGWLWYLGSLVPVIGLVQVGLQARADRYTYWPLIGILVALSWGVADVVTRRPSLGRALLFGAGLYLLLCFALTASQVRYWQNDVTLWEHTLQVTSGNALAHYNLAVAYEKRGRLPEAMHQYGAALQIRPDYPNAHAGLGGLLLKRGDLDEARRQVVLALESNPGNLPARTCLGAILYQQGQSEQAEEQFCRALQIDPAYLPARNGLGQALWRQGRLDEAEQCFRAVLEADPNSAEAQNNLGAVLLRRGQAAEALPHLAAAARLQPRSAAVQNGLGSAQRRCNQWEEAVASYRRAVDLEPRTVIYHANLAYALQELGQDAQAEAEYRAARTLDPDWPRAAGRAAWILATHPAARRRDPAEAVYLADLCCRATQYREPLLLDTLAAAYTEAGQFEQAIATGQKAIDAAGTALGSDQIQRLRAHLERYRVHQPLRDSGIEPVK
jgi:tetratricopeptide (TPR) repeat protein